MRKLLPALLLALLLPALAIAQTKISALPNGTTPDGTEVVPLVQSAATVKLTTQQIGFASMTDAVATNCITGLGAAAVKSVVLVNSGAGSNPTGFECSSQFGGTPAPTFAFDENNNALYMPGSAPTIVGGTASAGFFAFRICTGSYSLGACNNAIGVLGGSTGAVSVNGRNFAIQSGYEIALGGVPTTSGSTCTASVTQGGLGAGQFTASSTGSCVWKLNFPADTGFGVGGFVCSMIDETTPANTFHQTAHDATSCTMTGTQTSGDLVLFTAKAFG